MSTILIIIAEAGHDTVTHIRGIRGNPDASMALAIRASDPFATHTPCSMLDAGRAIAILERWSNPFTSRSVA